MRVSSSTYKQVLDSDISLPFVYQSRTGRVSSLHFAVLGIRSKNVDIPSHLKVLLEASVHIFPPDIF